jgi:RES domain
VNAPLPPADLASRTPLMVTLAPGIIVERFFRAALDPIHFDRTNKGRLNAPDGSYGVLYTAQKLRGAFAETFLRQPGRTLLPLDLISQKARVRLRITRMGIGLGRLGATAEVVHGGLPYKVPQAWSKALRDSFPKSDGIAYTARHDDEAVCYALFDHDPVSVVEASRDMNIDQDWFWQVAEPYGVGLAPS